MISREQKDRDQQLTSKPFCGVPISAGPKDLEIQKLFSEVKDPIRRGFTSYWLRISDSKVSLLYKGLVHWSFHIDSQRRVHKIISLKLNFFFFSPKRLLNI